ncbi:MAG: hypothetical protein IJI68_00985 [Eggerthellaceae bacterium]|nr:hypothetical protein [Eggerthellaceae bacterium]
MSENVKLWFKAAGIRALKTAAQIGLILIGSDIINIVALDWPYVLGCMAAGVVVSMLTSIAGLPEVDDGKSPLVGKHSRD